MQDPSSPPLRLGNYEPLLELASGGMATVYIARQLGAAGFERIVVVKRVHRHLLGNREFYDMFRDEARVASMIEHPNVVPVIDVVEVTQPERELFLVMDYVESSSLATLRKAAHEDEAAHPGADPRAHPLRRAHGASRGARGAIDMQGRPLGVVHRDVSPQNVIVGVDGSSRLIDFGVAKASHRLTETKSGSVKGKYSYMAPEQARGAEVDRRTDIFAAGIVLHECLTDRRLFRGENELDTVRRIMEAEIPPPSSVQPAIPAALDAVAMKALARPIEQRFQTAVEMAEAIEQAVSLASPREVAAYLEKTCGTRLGERRDALREMLAGTVAPLAVELAADPGESQPSRSLHVSGVMPMMVEPRDKSKAPMIALVAIAAAAVGALILVLANRSEHGRAVTTTTSTATSAVTASATPTAPPATTVATSTDVMVELTADAPIESVHLAGSKKIELAGTTARVALDPWSTPLKVEATLEGGKKVAATLEPGTTSARLAAPKKTTTAGATTANTNKPDLQGNPYGAQ